MVTVTEQWTYADIARHVGVSESTARKYASDGRLPPSTGRLGATPWWEPGTIRAWHRSRPGKGGRPKTRA